MSRCTIHVRGASCGGIDATSRNGGRSGSVIYSLLPDAERGWLTTPIGCDILRWSDPDPDVDPGDTAISLPSHSGHSCEAAAEPAFWRGPSDPYSDLMDGVSCLNMRGVHLKLP